MKTFLESFLAAAAGVLSAALQENVEITPQAQPAETGDTLAVELTVGGEYAGRLRIFADRAGLPALLSASGASQKPGGNPAEWWVSTLRATAAVVPGVKTTECTEIYGEAPASALASYQMRRGSAAVWVGFSDEVRKEPDADQVKNTAAGEPGKIPSKNFDLFLDVELEASLRFGSRELPLREVLDLGPGDVVELDRNVTDPVDLVVGDKIVARGEVVLVNGNFGLRVTEVAEPRSRLESIRCLF